MASYQVIEPYQAIEPYQVVASSQVITPCLVDTSFAAKATTSTSSAVEAVASSLVTIADTWAGADLYQFTHLLDVELLRLDS